MRAARRASPLVILVALVGAIIGFVVAVYTPATTQIAGSNAYIRLEPGRRYDQVNIAGVLTAKRATSRAVLGEPLGVRVNYDINADALVDENGQFDSDVLPAYVQAYSDPAQIVSDIRWALIRHALWFAGGGAVIALLLLAAAAGYRAWRRRYDLAHGQDGRVRAIATAYRAPERAFGRRAVVAVIVLAFVWTIPSGGFRPRPPMTLHTSPVLAGTPLSDVQITGLLKPAIVAVRSYIKKYFEQNNRYYDRLQRKTETFLAADPVRLPDGEDVAHFGFVTDRHCNIGMDRIIVTVLRHFHVVTLVSAGDDDFSGSFSFESVCTNNLAEKTRSAGITDVFAAGNHDSSRTLADEADEGIKVLTADAPVTADGLSFVGSPDPRSSRYGQGIQPSSPQEQAKLLLAQGTEIGKLACAKPGPFIAVLHDPQAGTAALQHGCGHIRLALDGHTHTQSGPNLVPLPDGGTGAQFTGDSTGGAPTQQEVDASPSFASRLTVGPLHHEGTVNIVSVERSTGRLVGITVFTFHPDQTIDVSQLAPPATG